jgi:HEAT repeat protein
MTTVILTLLLWGAALPPFQDLESQISELLRELMRPELAVQEQARRKLASLRGARPILETRLSTTDDPILRARLRDAVRECDREEQRRSLVEAMARATAEGYRPLAERVTSGDAGQVLHLLREMLPLYFGDPKRDEFRIVVCAALRAEGEGEAWDQVRIEALRLVRRGLAHEDSIQAAAEMLRHRTASVRRDALYTLAFLQAEGEAAPAAALLSDRDGEVRREAIRTLEALRSTAHIREIGALVQDPTPAVKMQAALTLARLGAAEFSTRIVSLVSDADAEVRQAGIRALGLLRARSFAGTIARRVGDPSDAVRIEAIEALAVIGATDQAGRIAEELHSSNTEVRVKALEALARLGVKEQAAGAARLLGDSHPRVRAAAALALAGLREAGRAAELAALLQDADAWVRRSAIQALVLLGAADQGDAVAGRLADRDPFVVTAAIRAIADLRLSVRAADALKYASTETLTDQFGSSIHLSMGDLIRAEALEAVGRLGVRSLAPKAAEFAADASPAVRRAAARALVRLEGFANPDRLEKLLADPDPSVGYETTMAINLHSAPGLAGRLQVEIETSGRETFLLKNSLAMIRDKTGLEISAAPQVAGLFQLPLALPSPVALDAVLHALARDSGFEVGFVADPSGASLRAMRRDDAAAELRRAIRSGK